MNLQVFSGSREDVLAYEALVCAGMHPDDVHTPEEFATMIGDGRLQAWWWVEGDEKVGWCAIYPWHNKFAPQAWHLYGIWVREDWRLKGLGEAMWRFMMEMVPVGVPMTVSAQPGKLGSEALVRKYGFEFVCWNAPWNEYVNWNK